jgi:hypothetical protein
MKRLELTVTDRRDIKKLQRISIVLSRLMDMVDEYKDVEIIIKTQPKKGWW